MQDLVDTREYECRACRIPKILCGEVWAPAWRQDFVQLLPSSGAEDAPSPMEEEGAAEIPDSNLRFPAVCSVMPIDVTHVHDARGRILRSHMQMPSDVETGSVVRRSGIGAGSGVS